MKKDYNDFIVINLINQTGREKPLGDAFTEGSAKYFKNDVDQRYELKNIF